MLTSRPHNAIRRGIVPGACAVMFLVAGCGSGSASQGAEPATSTASPSAAGVVLSVTGTEYSFAPPALKAAPGPTTFRFTNGGAVDHDFSIDSLHVHLTETPGKTGEATVTLTAGTYTFYCAIPGHRQSGMQGKLTVR
jgi:plastocyanin